MALPENEKSNLSDYRDNRIYIQTLGNFLVRRGNRVLSAESNKSQKMWELFKYIITNRDKNILPESIQEILWSDQDYDFSDKAFRTMIFRLRQTLKKGLDENIQIQPILYSQGCYRWNREIDYTLDLEEFEKNYLIAKQYKDTNEELAMKSFQKILKLYKGNYLPESMYTEWTIPLRNHFRHLYLQSMQDYCALLKRRNALPELIEVCRSIILLEPMEEEFHLYLMNALLNQGKIKDARKNYEYITAKLYQEFGLRPSPEMRSIYSKITAEESTNRAEINIVQEEMNGNSNKEGPFFCDKKTFQSIFELEKRRTERSGQSVFICLLTLEFNEPNGDADQAQRALSVLENIIDRSLRRGDVVTLWNNFQFLIILPSITMEQTIAVLGRVERTFKEKVKMSDILLRARYQSILDQTFLK